MNNLPAPLRILVSAPRAPITALLCDALRPECNDVRAREDGVSKAGIRFAADVPESKREAIATRLSPLSLVACEDAALPSGTVTVGVVIPAKLHFIRLLVHADSPAIAKQVCETLEPWCERKPRVKLLAVGEAPSVHFGGADPLLRGLARLAASGIGQVVPERAIWKSDDQDVYVYARSATRPIVPIELLTDDPLKASALVELLHDEGFPDVRVGAISSDEAAAERMAIVPGALAARPTDMSLSRLQFATSRFLSSMGVDVEQWPVEIAVSGDLPAGLTRARDARQHDADALHARVILPLRSHAEGQLRPYAGTSPARFSVAIRCDDAAATRAIVGNLEAQGIRSITASDLAPDDRIPLIEMQEVPDQSEGFAMFRRSVAELLPSGDTPTARVVSGAENHVTIVLPMHLTPREKEERARLSLAKHNIVVHHPRGSRGAGIAPLVNALRAAGFTRVSTRKSEPAAEEAGVHFGGAESFALGTVLDAVRGCGITVADPEKHWSDADMDIYVFVPNSASVQEPVAAGADPFATWDNPPVANAAPTDFIAVTGKRLRIGQGSLRRLPHAPNGTPDGFEAYVIDRTTAATLCHLVASILRREPALLEGPTSTSKTSVIQYLGALLGQPVVRINLSAQTDTSELIGRYMPTGDGEGRAAWRWLDGRVVRAMREGWWVVFDEINLAEPAVLERLNSLLEANPSLVLTEHDGEIFGSGGTPIHPSFRIFATMNPSTYAGRAPLSPAFRDRFLGYRSVSVPTETDIRDMLERLVLGRAHGFEHDGQVWSVPGGPAVFPWRGARTLIARTLRQVARFWSSLHGMGDGAEAAVHTRRGLLAIVQSVSKETRSGRGLDEALRAALGRYVVGRVSSQADRAALAHVLDACAIGPNQWELGGTPAAVPVPPVASTDDESEEDDDEIPFYVRSLMTGESP